MVLFFLQKGTRTFFTGLMIICGVTIYLVRMTPSRIRQAVNRQKKGVRNGKDSRKQTDWKCMGGINDWERGIEMRRKTWKTVVAWLLCLCMIGEMTDLSWMMVYAEDTAAQADTLPRVEVSSELYTDPATNITYMSGWRDVNNNKVLAGKTIKDGKEINAAIYSGAAIVPKITYYDGSNPTGEVIDPASNYVTGQITVDSDGYYTTTVSGDYYYKVKITKNIDAGTVPNLLVEKWKNVSNEKQLISSATLENPFSIVKKDVKDVTIEPVTKPYVGKPVTLETNEEIKIKCNGNDLRLKIGEDFDIIKYEENDKANTSATVTIRAKAGSSRFTGEKEFTLAIQKASLTDAEVIFPNVKTSETPYYTYAGNKEVKPEVEVKKWGQTLVADQDYEVDYRNANQVKEADNVADPPTVMVKAKADRNYEGEQTLVYAIRSLDLNTTNDVQVQLKSEETFDTLLKKWVEKTTQNKKDTFPDIIVKCLDYSRQEPEWVVLPSDDYEMKDWTFEKNTSGKRYLNITISGKNSWVVGEKEWKEVVVPQKQLSGTAENLKVLHTDELVDESQNYYYTGKAIQPKIEVTNEEVDEATGEKAIVTLTEGRDYKVTYSDNVNPGTATVTVEGQGDYKGVMETHFQIIPVSLNESNTEITVNKPQTYLGTQLQPSENDITVRCRLNDKIIKIDPKDYEIIEYGENINCGTGTFTVQGKNGYNGTIIGTFDIVAQPIENASVTFTSKEGLPYREAQDGTPIAVVPKEEDIKVSIGEKELKYDVDYTVEAANNTAPTNEAAYTITGIGNYTGTKTGKFSIKKDIANFVIKTVDAMYNGSDLTPKVQILDDYTGEIVPESAYTIQCDKKIRDAGAYDILITANANSEYMGSVTKVFTVQKRIIRKDGFTLAPIKNQQYTGSPITPDQELQLSYASYDAEKPVSLELGKDYTVRYVNNEAVSAEKGVDIIVTATEDGNFATPYGDVMFEDCFRILPRRIAVPDEGETQDEGNPTLSYALTTQNNDHFDQLFTESGLDYKIKDTKLVVTYCDNDGNKKELTLQEGTDYKIDYGDSKTDRIGTVDAVISGQGNFTGSIPLSYHIYADISENDKIKLEQAQGVHYIYTGSPIVPFFTKLYYDYGSDVLQNRTLIRDIDYEETNELGNNINASDGAYAVIRGKGNYFTGERKIYFKIEPKNIADEEVEVSGMQDEIVFNGNVTEQKPELTYNGMKLKEGEDYELTYSEPENKRVNVTGETPIRVILTGKGNYSGQRVLSYRIVPRDITVSDTNKNTITPMNWQEELEYNGEPREQSDANIRTMTYQNTQAGMTNIPMRYGTEEDLKGEHAGEVDYTVSYSEDHTSVGDVTVTLTGHGNYTGTYELSYRIYANLSNRAYTTAQWDEELQYTGAAIEPQVHILCAGKELKLGLGEDCQAQLKTTGDNVNVTKENSQVPIWSVTGTEPYYRGMLTGGFRIVPKNLDDAVQGEGDISIAPVEDTTYTGKEIKPDIQVYNHGNLMKEGEDYTIELRGEDHVNAGEKQVIVTGGTNGNYTGSMPLTYQIVPRDISQKGGILQAKGIEDKVYTGDVITQTPDQITYTNTAADMKDMLLEEGKDYTVEPSEAVEVGVASVTIQGIGNYQGSYSFTYQIKSATFENAVGQVEPQTYTGSELTPKVTIRMGEKTLREDVDYKITGYKNNKNVSEAGSKLIPTVEIQGIGGYAQGKMSVPFEIRPCAITQEDVTVTVPQPIVYTGSEQTPDLVLERKIPGTDGGQTMEKLEKDKDYTIAYKNNQKVGEASATITGLGNYSGEREQTFVIQPRSLEDEAVKLQPIAAQPYTGGAILPEVTLLYTNPDTKETSVLEKGTDYVVTAENNEGYGEADLYVTAVVGSNFTGSIHTKFTIKHNFADVQTAEQIEDQIIRDGAAEPKPSLRDGDTILEEGKDYTVRYENNDAAGTGYIICIPAEDSIYSGEKRIPFLIREELSDQMVVDGLAENGYTYTGEKIEPAFRLTARGRILTQDVDYTVSYEQNIEVGTAVLTITGMGLYTGVRSETYRIVPKSIAGAQVSEIATQIYTGEEITPPVTVGLDGKDLTKDVDYSIKYDHNKKVGTASVIISGQGNYGGTKIVHFGIRLNDATNLVAGAAKTMSLQLTWKGVKGAKGYAIYNGDNRLVKKVSTTSYRIRGLQSGTTYKFKVRAYVLSDGNMRYSAFTNTVVTTTLPAKPAVRVSSPKTKQARVVWRKSNGASGYEIYRAADKPSSFKKLVTVKNGKTVTYTDKKVSARRKYYYRVRAYKTMDGKKVYSSYSNTKMVVTK